MDHENGRFDRLTARLADDNGAAWHKPHTRLGRQSYTHHIDFVRWIRLRADGRGRIAGFCRGSRHRRYADSAVAVYNSWEPRARSRLALRWKAEIRRKICRLPDNGGVRGRAEIRGFIFVRRKNRYVGSQPARRVFGRVFVSAVFYGAYRRRARGRYNAGFAQGVES